MKRFIQVGTVEENGDVVMNCWAPSDEVMEEIMSCMEELGIDTAKPEVSMITRAADVPTVGDFNAAHAVVYEGRSNG